MGAADEAGFLFVARNWSPAPESVYGPLFVARPPPLIALVRATDALAGPYALRVLGALGVRRPGALRCPDGPAHRR